MGYLVRILQWNSIPANHPSSSELSKIGIAAGFDIVYPPLHHYSELALASTSHWRGASQLEQFIILRCTELAYQKRNLR